MRIFSVWSIWIDKCKNLTFCISILTLLPLYWKLSILPGSWWLFSKWGATTFYCHPSSQRGCFISCTYNIIFYSLLSRICWFVPLKNLNFTYQYFFCLAIALSKFLHSHVFLIKMFKWNVWSVFSCFYF